MGNVSIFRIALNFSFLSDVHFRSPCPLQTVQNIEKVGDFQAPFNTPKLHCKFSSATTLGVKTEQPFRHPSPRHPPPPSSRHHRSLSAPLPARGGGERPADRRDVRCRHHPGSGGPSPQIISFPFLITRLLLKGSQYIPWGGGAGLQLF